MPSDQNNITSFNALPPVVIRRIREAFEEALSEMQEQRGGHVVPDDTRAALARHIVHLAKLGECDSDRLRTAALNAAYN
jgi:hypothetical protein